MRTLMDRATTQKRMTAKPWIVGAAVVAVLFSACGGGAGAPTASAAATQAAATTAAATPAALLSTQAGSIGATWIRWDKASCKYQDAPKGGDTWTAVLRMPTTPFTLGFGTQGEGIALLDALNASMKATAAKVGVPLAYANYNTLNSTTDVITQAQTIALRKPDAVISFNVLTAQIPAVNALFGCTPIVQITAPAPNTVVFGASSSDVGKTEGQYLADYAKKQNWPAGSITVLGLQTPSLGASIGERITLCQSAVQSLMPGAKVDNLPSVASTTADAQTKTTDWLTAHPNDHNVLVCTISDIYAFGVANAFKGANRAQDGVVVGAGGGTDAIATIKGGGPYLGSVDFGWGKYPDYLIPLDQDILEGKAVPSEIHQKLTVLDKSNVN